MTVLKRRNGAKLEGVETVRGETEGGIKTCSELSAEEWRHNR